MIVTRYQSGCSYGLQASVSSPWALTYLLNSIVFAMSAVTLVVRSELFKRYNQMLCKVFLRYSDKTEPKTSQWMLGDQICNMSAIQIGLLSVLQHLCHFPRTFMLPSLPQIVSAGIYQAGMSVGDLKVAKGNLIVREHYCAILFYYMSVICAIH